MALTGLLPSKNIVILILVTANVIAIAWIFISRNAVEKSTLVYRNPSTAEQVRIVRVQGPVRIVERIVETPGEKVTDRTETHDVITESNESDSAKGPTFQPPGIGRQYILGGSWRTSLTKNGTVWAGASIIRGLDFLVGVGSDDGKAQGYLMVQGRFGG